MKRQSREVRCAIVFGATLHRVPALLLAPESTMLGPPKPRRLDELIAVSLEDLVPRDHFYRHLEATLDLSFVRQ